MPRYFDMLIQSALGNAIRHLHCLIDRTADAPDQHEPDAACQ